jgi:hypothetical protein
MGTPQRQCSRYRLDGKVTITVFRIGIVGSDPYGGTATLLKNGSVLIIGGRDSTTAELYQ